VDIGRAERAPGRRRWLFVSSAATIDAGGPSFFFLPAGGGEAKMLEESVGDHGHQRATMKTAPGTAFEVVEAEFFLELLMSLLADPAP
jgi:hypothetical protein